MGRSNLGSTMREARIKLGLSQEAVAARVGTDQTTISQMELGKVRGQYEMIIKLADELGGRRADWVRLAGYPVTLDDRTPAPTAAEARIWRAVWANAALAEQLRRAVAYEEEGEVRFLMDRAFELTAKALEIEFARLEREKAADAERERQLERERQTLAPVADFAAWVQQFGSPQQLADFLMSAAGAAPAAAPADPAVIPAVGDDEPVGVGGPPARRSA